ncbi:hypothetical protein CALCODRAFT_513417 [Calocera cornea HHB12733]|uniref:Uncharacterized protein n=1 Tax=Calocera cornea HHB12733 TaxID=1353952 RepID=A0A165C4N2_9BASI|nr:hypothetical protein CALCODRAFT_513417 [Calocera cornea HHB12733]
MDSAALDTPVARKEWLKQTFEDPLARRWSGRAPLEVMPTSLSEAISRHKNHIEKFWIAAAADDILFKDISKLASTPMIKGKGMRQSQMVVRHYQAFDLVSDRLQWAMEESLESRLSKLSEGRLYARHVSIDPTLYDYEGTSPEASRRANILASRTDNWADIFDEFYNSLCRESDSAIPSAADEHDAVRLARMAMKEGDKSSVFGIRANMLMMAASIRAMEDVTYKDNGMIQLPEYLQDLGQTQNQDEDGKKKNGLSPANLLCPLELSAFFSPCALLTSARLHKHDIGLQLPAIKHSLYGKFIPYDITDEESYGLQLFEILLWQGGITLAYSHDAILLGLDLLVLEAVRGYNSTQTIPNPNSVYQLSCVGSIGEDGGTDSDRVIGTGGGTASQLPTELSLPQGSLLDSDMNGTYFLVSPSATLVDVTLAATAQKQPERRSDRIANGKALSGNQLPNTSNPYISGGSHTREKKRRAATANADHELPQKRSRQASHVNPQENLIYIDFTAEELKVEKDKLAKYAEFHPETMSSEDQREVSENMLEFVPLPHALNDDFLNNLVPDSVGSTQSNLSPVGSAVGPDQSEYPADNVQEMEYEIFSFKTRLSRKKTLIAFPIKKQFIDGECKVIEANETARCALRRIVPHMSMLVPPPLVPAGSTKWETSWPNKPYIPDDPQEGPVAFLTEKHMAELPQWQLQDLFQRFNIMVVDMSHPSVDWSVESLGQWQDLDVKMKALLGGRVPPGIFSDQRMQDDFEDNGKGGYFKMTLREIVQLQEAMPGSAPPIRVLDLTDMDVTDDLAPLIRKVASHGVAVRATAGRDDVSRDPPDCEEHWNMITTAGDYMPPQLYSMGTALSHRFHLANPLRLAADSWAFGLHRSTVSLIGHPFHPSRRWTILKEEPRFGESSSSRAIHGSKEEELCTPSGHRQTRNSVAADSFVQLNSDYVSEAVCWNFWEQEDRPELLKVGSAQNLPWPRKNLLALTFLGLCPSKVSPTHEEYRTQLATLCELPDFSRECKEGYLAAVWMVRTLYQTAQHWRDALRIELPEVWSIPSRFEKSDPPTGEAPSWKDIPNNVQDPSKIVLLKRIEGAWRSASLGCNESEFSSVPKGGSNSPPGARGNTLQQTLVGELFMNDESVSSGCARTRRVALALPLGSADPVFPLITSTYFYSEYLAMDTAPPIESSESIRAMSLALIEPWEVALIQEGEREFALPTNDHGARRALEQYLTGWGNKLEPLLKFHKTMGNDTGLSNAISAQLATLCAAAKQLAERLPPGAGASGNVYLGTMRDLIPDHIQEAVWGEERVSVASWSTSDTLPNGALSFSTPDRTRYRIAISASLRLQLAFHDLVAHFVSKLGNRGTVDSLFHDDVEIYAQQLGCIWERAFESLERVPELGLCGLLRWQLYLDARYCFEAHLKLPTALCIDVQKLFTWAPDIASNLRGDAPEALLRCERASLTNPENPLFTKVSLFLRRIYPDPCEKTSTVRMLLRETHEKAMILLCAWQKPDVETTDKETCRYFCQLVSSLLMDVCLCYFLAGIEAGDEELHIMLPYLRHMNAMRSRHAELAWYTPRHVIPKALWRRSLKLPVDIIPVPLREEALQLYDWPWGVKLEELGKFPGWHDSDAAVQWISQSVYYLGALLTFFSFDAIDDLPPVLLAWSVETLARALQTQERWPAYRIPLDVSRVPFCLRHDAVMLRFQWQTTDHDNELDLSPHDAYLPLSDRIGLQTSDRNSPEDIPLSIYCQAVSSQTGSPEQQPEQHPVASCSSTEDNVSHIEPENVLHRIAFFEINFEYTTALPLPKWLPGTQRTETVPLKIYVLQDPARWDNPYYSTPQNYRLPMAKRNPKPWVGSIPYKATESAILGERSLIPVDFHLATPPSAAHMRYIGYTRIRDAGEDGNLVIAHDEYRCYGCKVKLQSRQTICLRPLRVNLNRVFHTEWGLNHSRELKQLLYGRDVLDNPARARQAIAAHGSGLSGSNSSQDSL